MIGALKIPGLSRAGAAEIQLQLLPQTVTQCRSFTIAVDRQKTGVCVAVNRERAFGGVFCCLGKKGNA